MRRPTVVDAHYARDEAICIGSGPRKDYLNIERIIQAAQSSQAEAIHPGYGFLAKIRFFQAVHASGLVFVGLHHRYYRYGQQGHRPPDHEGGWNSRIPGTEVLRMAGKAGDCGGFCRKAPFPDYGQGGRRRRREESGRLTT